MSHRQEIFDRIATHLLTQKQKSLMPDGYHCAYRGAGGLRCSVGCLIEDAAYRPELEGSAACCTFVKQAIQASLGYELTPEEYKLIDSMQSIHDNIPHCDWRAELAKYARRSDLTMVST